MSNKLLYIVVFLIGLGSSSCEKYFEVDDTTRNSIPGTFSTIDGFRSAMNGTYGTLLDYYATEFYIYPEVAGNMVNVTRTGQLILKPQQDFISAPEDEVGAVGYIWRKPQYTIAHANNIIEYAPGYLETHAGDKAEIDLIKAQALFIRALARFDLVRVYAQPYNYTADASHPGIPLVNINPAPEDDIPRASVKDAYTEIIKDLKDAESLFGSTAASSPYFASKKAVQALLARVYLYSENWDEAISYSTEVINNSTLATGANYAAMFNELAPGVETIFRVTGKLRTKRLGEVYSVKDPIYVAADTLISLFDDPTDVRLQLFQKVGSWYATKKWTITVPFTPNEEKYDPMVLRASELYFIRAEANWAKDRLTDAANDMKEIIGRALNKPKGDVVLDETKDGLKRVIIKERAKEFCFEGHNFFDITRMKQNLIRENNTSSVVKRIDYPSNYFVLPIPQSEIDANPAMKGNPTVNK